MNPGFASSPQSAVVNDRLDVHFYCAPAPSEAEAEVVIDRFPFVLGRHPECDVTLFSRQVSRRHCQLFQRGEEIWVEDLNSYNGTYLNDHKIGQAEPIRDGDVLVLHPYRYVCRFETAPPGGPRLRLLPDGVE